MDEFRATLSRSLGMALLLTIPSSVGLAVLGESMIGAVYQGGRFTAFDTHQTALALACYSAGLAGYSAIKILAPAFYALNDARTPMLVSLASIAVNLAAARPGAAGRGWATRGWRFPLRWWRSRARRRCSPCCAAASAACTAGTLAVSAAKICAAAALMGVVCRLSSLAVHAATGARQARATGRCGDLHPAGGGGFLRRRARASGIAELEAVRGRVLHCD